MTTRTTSRDGGRRARRTGGAVLLLALVMVAGIAIAPTPAAAAGGHRFPVGGCPGSWTYGSYRNHPRYGSHGAGLAIDINAPGDLGKNVYASYRGKISRINRANGEITITHPTGTKARYAHMSGIPGSFKVGTSISQGQRVGRVGGVGAGGNANAHLHYEQMNANGSARTITFRGKAIGYPWKTVSGRYASFSGVKAKSAWC